MNRLLKKSGSAIIFCILSTTFLYPIDKVEIDGAIFFGYRSLNVVSLNKKMKLSNLPTFNNDNMNIGLRIGLFLDHFLIQAEVEDYRAEKITIGNRVLFLDAQHYLLNFGIKFNLSNNLFFIPVFGFGAGYQQLDIFNNTPVDFDTTITSANQNLELIKKDYILYYGGRLEYFFWVTDRTGIFAGFEISYIQSFDKGSWYNGGNTDLFAAEKGTIVPAGPESFLTGFQTIFYLGVRSMIRDDTTTRGDEVNEKTGGIIEEENK